MGAQPPTIKQIKKRLRVSTQKETEGLNTKRDQGSQYKRRDSVAKGLNTQKRLCS